MPELPEVEIAKRNLSAWTRGRRLERVLASSGASYIFRPSRPAALARALEGARFVEVNRKGKQLLLSLEKDGAPVGLLAHLGMTGKWLRRPAGDPPTRFSRARLVLDDGTALHFDDMRLFGRLRVVEGARFEEVSEVAALGRDPLRDGIDAGALGEALGRSRIPVKVRIMDQSLLPGVGNIYASEALFRARIDPRRKSLSLAPREVRALSAAILAALRDGIARSEGPEPTYVEEPGAKNPFLVYAREGVRCPRCRRADIQRIVQAQRSTFFCPRCQR